MISFGEIVAFLALVSCCSAANINAFRDPSLFQVPKTFIRFPTNSRPTTVTARWIRFSPQLQHRRIFPNGYGQWTDLGFHPRNGERFHTDAHKRISLMSTLFWPYINDNAYPAFGRPNFHQTIHAHPRNGIPPTAPIHAHLCDKSHDSSAHSIKVEPLMEAALGKDYTNHGQHATGEPETRKTFEGNELHDTNGMENTHINQESFISENKQRLDKVHSNHKTREHHEKLSLVSQANANGIATGAPKTLREDSDHHLKETDRSTIHDSLDIDNNTKNESDKSGAHHIEEPHVRHSDDTHITSGGNIDTEHEKDNSRNMDRPENEPVMKIEHVVHQNHVSNGPTIISTSYFDEVTHPGNQEKSVSQTDVAVEIKDKKMSSQHLDDDGNDRNIEESIESGDNEINSHLRQEGSFYRRNDYFGVNTANLKNINQAHHGTKPSEFRYRRDVSKKSDPSRELVKETDLEGKSKHKESKPASNHAEKKPQTEDNSNVKAVLVLLDDGAVKSVDDPKTINALNGKPLSNKEKTEKEANLVGSVGAGVMHTNGDIIIDNNMLGKDLAEELRRASILESSQNHEGSITTHHNLGVHHQEGKPVASTHLRGKHHRVHHGQDTDADSKSMMAPIAALLIFLSFFIVMAIIIAKIRNEDPSPQRINSRTALYENHPFY